MQGHIDTLTSHLSPSCCNASWVLGFQWQTSQCGAATTQAERRGKTSLKQTQRQSHRILEGHIHSRMCAAVLLHASLSSPDNSPPTLPKYILNLFLNKCQLRYIKLHYHYEENNILKTKGNYGNLEFKSGLLSGSGKDSWVLQERDSKICLRHPKFGGSLVEFLRQCLQFNSTF